MTSLDLPQSASTVEVFLIDSGARLDFPAQQFMTPAIRGYDRMAVPSYCFLVTHPSGQRILFDLSIRSDFQNLAPLFAERCTNTASSGWKISSPHNVSEILVANGVPLADINAIIWSHHHFDHTGDPSLFPSSTNLVVGPGFTRNFTPGWPEQPESPVKSADWHGRTLREIQFDEQQLKIGRFPAVDWFGDGSFYLLHTPGHTPDHMVGLARVQSDSFVLMGADFAHHPGEFRPSKHSPMPERIRPSPLPSHPRFGSVCPGHLFHSLGRHPGANDSPFFEPAEEYTHDFDECLRTIDLLTKFDADERVLVLTAHDHSLLPIFTGAEDGNAGWCFPHRTLNGWREAGLADRGRWRFLNDFRDAVGEE
ncbi:metallo-beta-lactamase superfamily protein [Aspergillus japonicus CBS 114.51]|uniref:Metallo-beta-lactamase superfamily protein n=1 Tax=Aspergillus japonicus CBS 114.51 TaxID=1448312 RepID=A0A8T8X990_ASPJA|nr:metallo-beta-lactamase superfamily protein [Aspergillus japonicus CBS 114.51]RAH84641.1 metallo-beta-lactamase superfamily protein [Aspergillus japonicus CBS 114.51]